ncbi:hypothetical protein [Nostoc sp.]|uniref:hypothetical protein n=1 Tax=Nostoc sp. TaxID=1180 RepID=UPI002FF7F436
MATVETVQACIQEIKDIPVEELRAMSQERLHAIALRLPIGQFTDKEEQIQAIVFGRSFFALAHSFEEEKEPTKEEKEATARYFHVERIKETWSLKELRLLALENEVAPIKGHPRHRETWINALIDAGVFQ